MKDYCISSNNAKEFGTSSVGEYKKYANEIAKAVRKNNSNVQIYIRTAWPKDDKCRDSNMKKMKTNAISVAKDIKSTMIDDIHTIYKVVREKALTGDEKQVKFGS